MFAWWVPGGGQNIKYWGGATQGCSCGMTNSCADPSKLCNCDKNDNIFREDSGFLTNKSHLPVSQLRFGDTGSGKNGRISHTWETCLLWNEMKLEINRQQIGKSGRTCSIVRRLLTSHSFHGILRLNIIAYIRVTNAISFYNCILL